MADPSRIRTLARLLIVAALLGWAGRPAAAQDLAPALGPLAASVGLGAQGSWTVLTERGRVVLSDPDDPGAIRFYSIPWQGDRLTGRSTGVRVLATGMDGAAGGLVYSVREDFPRWVALVVTADKNIVLYVRQETGLVELKRVPIPGGLHPEGELLQISERGGLTILLANGVEVGRLTMATAGTTPEDRPVGIVAIGPGRFGFRDFAFGQAVVPRIAGGDDRIPGRPAPTAGRDDRTPTRPDTTVPAPTPASTPAEARRWPVPQLDPLAANVLGATMGIFAHEFGHFVINELSIPATGPEEDVADEFAAMQFVDNMRDMPEAAASMALAMAKFWWYIAEDRGDKQPPWFDEHAPDRARFGRVMCMLYGAAPQLFEDVMQQTGIPERTRARCIDDERKRHAAWDNLLRGHRRRGVDPVMPGDLDPATPGKRMTIEFRAPRDHRFDPLVTFFKQTRMLETAAELVTKLYVLPRDTKIIVEECGVANCFYRPSDGSVTMCYEMLAFVMDVFNHHEGSSGPVAADKPPAPEASAPPPPPPVARQGASGMNLAAFLAGTWHLVNRGDNGVVDDIQIEAMADGTYRAHHNAGRPDGAKLAVGVLGRWSTEPAAGDRDFQLTLTPVQWSPRQFCGGDGKCQPLDLGPTRLVVTVVDRNTLLSAQGRATRIQ